MTGIELRSKGQDEMLYKIVLSRKMKGVFVEASSPNAALEWIKKAVVIGKLDDLFEVVPAAATQLSEKFLKVQTDSVSDFQENS